MTDPTRKRRSEVFCPDCGNSASTDDEYCSHCGHEIPPVGGGSGETFSGDSTAERRGVASFRRRIRHLESNGWEIERDDDDEVVLLRRGIGSFWAHIALVLFTWGIGNLLYAWYNYTVSPRRVILRADGEGYNVIDPRRAPDVPSSGQAVPQTQFVFGVLVLVIAVTILLTAWWYDDLVAAGIGIVSLAGAIHLMSALFR